MLIAFCLYYTSVPTTASTPSQYQHCAMTTKRCYCYEDLNYIVYEYLVRLYIKQLTIEQWEELIKDLNVLKDVEAQ